MDITQILPLQSIGVRTTLALSSLLFRSLVEADEVRKEEEAQRPTPARMFEETCAEAGVPLQDLDAALAEFMGGGPELTAQLGDLREFAARNPDLGAFLQNFALRLTVNQGPSPSAANESARAKAAAPPPPPPPPQETTMPPPCRPEPSAPRRGRFHPEFAPSAAPPPADDADRGLDERLARLEAMLARIEREQAALRQHVHAELSTSRLLERVERLREELPTESLH